MENKAQHTKYSVLDLALVAQDRSIKETFDHSIELARLTEQLGFERYWFAEHHNMPHVASSATAVLISHIANHTTKIRVGSGGIMLPNHTPLVIAEQFGTLAHMFPNRIDLGLGRAPGTDGTTAMEIRGGRYETPQQFPQDVLKLQRYLGDDNYDGRVRAIPGEGTNVPIWILGSSTESAHLAASYGLPYAFASHFAPTHFVEAVNIYRQNFRPSAVLQKPYVLACVNVVAAQTDEEAEFLSSSLKMAFLGIITNKRKPLQPPVADIESLYDPMELYAVEQMLAVSFIAGPDTLKTQLSQFIEQTGVDEIMVSSHMFSQEAKLRSYEIFAHAMATLPVTTS